MKHFVLGTDEAGYGPNLGPFVVTYTCWELSETAFNKEYDDPEQLQKRLSEVIVDSPQSLKKHPQRILIGDSKKIYTSSKSLKLLQQTVGHMLRLLGFFPTNWPELLQTLAPEDAESVFMDYASEQSFVDQKEKITSHDCFVDQGIALRNIQSRVITPRKFNELLKKLGNKSHLLTDTTMGLVAAAFSNIDSGQITVICDKHGGRNRYLDVLYHWFPDHPITIVTEGRDASVYRFGPKGRPVEFRFLAKADRMIPTGLASMVSKYLRELAMEIFNRFWQEKLPHLQPTAGYPVDAVRFYKEIEAESKKQGIPQSILWRER